MIYVLSRLRFRAVLFHEDPTQCVRREAWTMSGHRQAQFISLVPGEKGVRAQVNIGTASDLLDRSRGYVDTNGNLRIRLQLLNDKF